MAKLDLPKWVMAAINFKGGTGKTTVALAIAEGICRLLKKRVAVIDCDFQCSASIALLGRRTLNDLIGRNATMDGLLQRKLTEGNGAHLGSSAVKTHFSIKEAAGLMHLLPGSPDMPRRERQIVASFLLRSDLHSAYETAAVKMGELFRSLLDDFDFVLIDCPPGLTLFSEAAIRAADGLVIPTLPNEILVCRDRSPARGDCARAARPLVRRPPGRDRRFQGAAQERGQQPSVARGIDRATAGSRRASVQAAAAVSPLLPGAGRRHLARRRGPRQLCEPLRPVVGDDRAAGGGICRQMRRADGAPEPAVRQTSFICPTPPPR